MLNTGLHNPNVKDKVGHYGMLSPTYIIILYSPPMEKFIMMNKGLDNGQDLPQELLTVWDPY